MNEWYSFRFSYSWFEIALGDMRRGVVQSASQNITIEYVTIIFQFYLMLMAFFYLFRCWCNERNHMTDRLYS